MAIRDWDDQDRPREKLMQQGAFALRDAELLAIFLRTGIVGKSAVDLAEELVTHFGSLTGLFAASLTDICAIKGMGEAKYVQLQAVLEMARRALADNLTQQAVMNSPAVVKQHLHFFLKGKTREHFIAMFLNQQNALIATEELAQGTVNQAHIYPREVAKRALELNACALIIAHNHPSGNASPSQADIDITEHLAKGLHFLDIRLLDHFIVAGNQVVSMVEMGIFQAK